ncbi:alpha-ketoglutarate-dependent sulfonate dioxygenase [Cucurbitaria berberidis CBS 394.84]|uniref:Alpha-ketoglutarate-dependent sulfonate dioxygenase n=1 Tax=Cucurbitaria berberidis CBS 394.84 TaxID=1168544 RepID=A0A9P4GCK3_9PLEO|nr:alpha-ketoglutarate-dependent sulfonate dioxygenase [Cucurbitaria berberidis CBS 394.84]KAF1842754.1 alpha-ketoglutarate-dependent sulfonate dioxygenase [Cucurbitaria berberidis CBS 394.84]
MGHHRSRRPTSSDSGYDTTSEGPTSPSNDRIESRVTVESPGAAINQKGERLSAGDERSSFLSSTTRTDLNLSIGTELSDIQLSSLNPQQLDELALLVSERGVVFFRDQDLTSEEQIHIFDHYGASGERQIAEKSQGSLKVKRSKEDHGEKFTYASGRQNEWTSDRSFEVEPPSYAMARVEEVEGFGADTVWVSQYGLYDALSKRMKSFLDDLDAVHTSKFQYDSIVNLRGMPSNRGPVETYHPAVRTHPVTGLKALNVTPGSVTAFEDLTRKESDKLLELLEYQINSSDEQTVRFRWEAGSVAIWDNRCTAHKSIPGSTTNSIKIIETAVLGEKPYLDPRSESRDERGKRLAREALQEQERLKEIKARYNNTPLRRILRYQAYGGECTFGTISSTSSANDPSSKFG